MVISIAEYRALQDQARELQRLLGTRRDFNDGSSRDSSREYGPPREVYR
jgi:hypothetical protein